MGRTLSRHEVLRWRDNWSGADKVAIEHALSLLPEADYTEPNSKGYVGARVGGRIALYVCPGYLFWTSPRWIEERDPVAMPGGIGADEKNGRWYELSTFGNRGDRIRQTFVELEAPCPRCFMVPTVTGACHCD